MGIPVPSRLTPDEIDACERFSLAVWGVLLFDREPSHNGRHGHTCPACSLVLADCEAEADRLHGIRQPWDCREAA
jgi:hypothetical protein